MSEHSDCSPSTLKRRIECPGSRNAERGRPDIPSSYAAEGTVFHEVVALCLEFGLEPDDFLDKEFEVESFKFVFDEEFAKHARPALDRVREMMIDCDYTWIEQRVNIGAFTEEGQFGTLDVGGVNIKRRIIRLHDWKYGAGVTVTAEGNWQAAAYVLGLWDDFAWRLLGSSDGVTVEIIIDQPRMPHGATVWTLQLNDLLKLVPTLIDAIKRTNDPDAPRHAGLEWCFFCKARGSCAELARFNLEQAALKFEEMDAALPQTRDLTDEEIAKIVRNAPLWSVWMRSVHEYALQSILQGVGPTKYLKAVPGRSGHRYWVDEGAAERGLKKQLGAAAYNRKLISPAMAEKRLPAKILSDFVPLWKQRENKPSLVAIDDQREAIKEWSAGFENWEKEDG